VQLSIPSAMRIRPDLGEEVDAISRSGLFSDLVALDSAARLGAEQRPLTQSGLMNSMLPSRIPVQTPATFNT